MTCENCKDQGFRLEVVREKGILWNRYILCRCEIGTELEQLWDKYPAWLGAPYSFFNNRKLNSGNPDDVITGGL